MSEEIQKEVQARVDFKLNELLSAMKQAAARNWNIAFQSGNPKYSHYWEAFEEMTKMLEKERLMSLPYDEVYLYNQRMKRDIAVDTICYSLRLLTGSRDFHHQKRMIASAVEKAQTF